MICGAKNRAIRPSTLPIMPALPKFLTTRTGDDVRDEQLKSRGQLARRDREAPRRPPELDQTPVRRGRDIGAAAVPLLEESMRGDRRLERLGPFAMPGPIQNFGRSVPYPMVPANSSNRWPPSGARTVS